MDIICWSSLWGIFFLWSIPQKMTGPSGFILLMILQLLLDQWKVWEVIDVSPYCFSFLFLVHFHQNLTCQHTFFRFKKKIKELWFIYEQWVMFMFCKYWKNNFFHEFYMIATELELDIIWMLLGVTVNELIIDSIHEWITFHSSI